MKKETRKRKNEGTSSAFKTNATLPTRNMYIRVSMYVYIYIFMYKYIRTYIHMYTYIYIRICNMYARVCIYLCTYVYRDANDTTRTWLL